MTKALILNLLLSAPPCTTDLAAASCWGPSSRATHQGRSSAAFELGFHSYRPCLGPSVAVTSSIPAASVAAPFAVTARRPAPGPSAVGPFAIAPQLLAIAVSPPCLLLQGQVQALAMAPLLQARPQLPPGRVLAAPLRQLRAAPRQLRFGALPGRPRAGVPFQRAVATLRSYLNQSGDFR